MLGGGLFGLKPGTIQYNPDLFEVLDLDFSEFPVKAANTSKGVVMQNHIIYFRELRLEICGGLFGNSSNQGEIEFFALNLETLIWNKLDLPRSNINIHKESFNMCVYEDKIVMLGVSIHERNPENLIMEVMFFDFEGKPSFLK